MGTANTNVLVNAKEKKKKRDKCRNVFGALVCAFWLNFPAEHNASTVEDQHTSVSFLLKDKQQMAFAP